MVHRDKRRAAFAADAALQRWRRRRRVGTARARAAIAGGCRGEDAVETGLKGKIGVAEGRERLDGVPAVAPVDGAAGRTGRAVRANELSVERGKVHTHHELQSLRVGCHAG